MKGHGRMVVRGFLLAGALFCWGPSQATLVRAEPSGAAFSQPPPTGSVQDLLRSVALHRVPEQEVARLQALAATDPPKVQDAAVLQAFYRKRGEAKRRLGRMDEAILDQRRAADEYANEDLPAQVDNLIDLGIYELQGGNSQQGLAALDRALSLLHPKIMGFAMTIHRLRVGAYARFGDLVAAENALQDAQKVMEVLRQWRRPRQPHLLPHWEASLETARASLLFQQGRWTQAEEAAAASVRHLDQAMAQYQLDTQDEADREKVQRRLNAMLQNRISRQLSLARIYMKQGRLVQAEWKCREALEQGLQVFSRGSGDAAEVLELLSEIMSEQGRSSEAVALAEEVVRTYESGGVARQAATYQRGRKMLALALVANRQYEQADAVLSQLQADDPAQAPVLYFNVGTDWAIALMQTGRAQQAIALLQTVLARAHAMQASESQIRQLQAFEAMAWHAAGHHVQAWQRYAQLMPDLLGQMRQDVAEVRMGLPNRQRERWRMLLEDQLALLAKMPRASQAASDEVAAQAFALAELARNSRVQEALQASAARSHVQDPQLMAMAREEQDLQQRIGALEASLMQWMAASPGEQAVQVRARLHAQIEQLKPQRQHLQQTLTQQFPQYKHLSAAPVPPTLAQLRQTLRADEVMVAWYFAEHQGFVWALSRQGPVHFQPLPLGRAALAHDVARLRQSLAPDASTVQDIPPFDLRLAHALHQAVLAPVQKALKGKRVLLAIPHAELGQVPLSLLVTKRPASRAGADGSRAYRRAAWLMNDWAIAQLPSATSLLTLRSMPAVSAERRAFAGFGDPLFSRAQLSMQEAPMSVRRGAVAAVHLRRVPLRRGVSQTELALLPRLPDTRLEVEQVGRVLGADPAQDFFLQQQASVSRVLGTDLSNRRVVLFATHGLVPGDLAGLHQPALALSAPEVTGEAAGDGLLTLTQVLDLKLHADWVVLSACNTASGEGVGEEAVSGLGRAFLYAGARALLVSSWPVDSDASRQLMVDLFAHQQRHPGVHKASHLQAAMRKMLKSGAARDARGRALYAHAHPLFWAPFVMLGD